MTIFFFQAEDGIRDLTVTGIQTCALPILRRPTLGHLLAPVDHAERDRRPAGGSSHRRDPQGRGQHVPRSEERRVGKECRSRWPPDHYIEKKILRHARISLKE